MRDNLSIDINWFIQLSDRIDNWIISTNDIITEIKQIKNDINQLKGYFNEIQNYSNELNNQLALIQKNVNQLMIDSDNIKAIQILQTETLKNIIQNDNNAAVQTSIISNDIKTLSAKLNDNELNVSYVDDKVSDTLQLLNSISDQITQLQENTTFPHNQTPNGIILP